MFVMSRQLWWLFSFVPMQRKSRVLGFRVADRIKTMLCFWCLRKSCLILAMSFRRRNEDVAERNELYVEDDVVLSKESGRTAEGIRRWA